MGEARTANWKAPGSEQWTVPMDGGGGRAFRLGKQAMNVQMQAFGNVARPHDAGDWTLRAVPTTVSEVTEAFATRDILLTPIQGICRPAAPPSDFARSYIRGPALIRKLFSVNLTACHRAIDLVRYASDASL